MENTFVEVPLDSISPDALYGVAESFVLREGTDYGAQEVSLDTKVKQVLRQIQRGDVKIIFDTATESIDLMTINEFRKKSHTIEQGT